MGAIDLLLDVKLDSERLHQLALGSLLIKTNVLKHVGIKATPDREDFLWEPHRGRFDLAVSLDDGKKAWVEIKVDSTLSDTQREAQLQFVFHKPEQEGHHLIYLLLGCSQYFHDPTTLERELTQRKGDHVGLARVLTASQLRQALERPDILPDRNIESRDVRDLVAAYSDALLRLDNRCGWFPGRPLGEWGPFDYIGAFAHCKKTIDSMRDAGIGYVPTPSGGFHGCWWGARALGNKAHLYLQFENATLCFKVAVAESVRERTRRAEIWRAVNESLMREAQGSKIELKRPRRFRAGGTMTVAVVAASPLEAETDWERLNTVRGVVAQAEAIAQRVADHAVA